MNRIITNMGYITNTKLVWYSDLNDVLNEIKEGSTPLFDLYGNDCYLDDLVTEMRQQPEEKLREYKEKTLPAIAFNGLFRSGMELMHYNDITAIDIDHIGGRDKLEAMRQKLIADPHSVAVFETPSGDGLKVIVRHDNTDPERHSDMYKQIMTYYDCYDPKCSDLKRRHFLSYDPLLWINPVEALPFHYDAALTELAKPKATDSPRVETKRRKSDKSIIAMLNAAWTKQHPEYWMEGHRACGVFEACCQLCKSGVDEELALQYCLDKWLGTGLDEREIEYNCRGGYKHIRRIGEESVIQW